jgi:hypothetical protein
MKNSARTLRPASVVSLPVEGSLAKRFGETMMPVRLRHEDPDLQIEHVAVGRQLELSVLQTFGFFARREDFGSHG